MIISESKKFIFIHIWKTGGTSITEILSKYKSTNPKYNDLPKHIRTTDLKSKYPLIFKQYYKFLFVRNPWDIQVSYYNYVKQNIHHSQHHFIDKFSSFEDYIIWRTSEKPDLQYDFVFNNKHELLVDYVGEFENLNKDFNIILKRLNLPQESLPQSNSSIRSHYRHYYTDFSASLIADTYKKDIEAFNYKF